MQILKCLCQYTFWQIWFSKYSTYFKIEIQGMTAFHLRARSGLPERREEMLGYSFWMFKNMAKENKLFGIVVLKT